nr:PREDICTED: uncharacterized protein LOC105661917 isoform X2 [Megachile rotundata]
MERLSFRCYGLFFAFKTGGRSGGYFATIVICEILRILEMRQLVKSRSAGVVKEEELFELPWRPQRYYQLFHDEANKKRNRSTSKEERRSFVCGLRIRKNRQFTRTPK